MSKRFILIVVLFTSLLLSACNPFQASQKNNLKVQSSPSPLANPSTVPSSETTTQSSSMQTGTNSAPQKVMPEYKTIADFKKIDAATVTLKTTKGDIVLELFRDKAPLTTANFLDLVDKKFYDGIVFHRVIADFMAQTGDPLTLDESKKALWGTGGPGYKIQDEFDPSLKHDKAGILSMANSGPNTGGSQFFITFEATPWLDGKHAVFGQVKEGLDVLMQIQQGDKILSATYQ